MDYHPLLKTHAHKAKGSQDVSSVNKRQILKPYVRYDSIIYYIHL